MIPSTEEMLLPIMILLSDNKPHKIKEVVDSLAKQFNISTKERLKLTPVAKRGVFYTRVLWAVSTLRNSGLLENIEKGVFKITQRGSKVIKDKPQKIDRKFLSQFIEYRNFVKQDKSKNMTESKNNTDITSPIETIENSYIEIEQDLQNELLRKVKKISPFVFQELINELFTAMGYGLPKDDSQNKTRDGGIDGIISKDELGLERVCVQAKRWENKVGAPVIRDFIGALHTKHAKKGAIITTSVFTKDAIKSAKRAARI